jgi:hypothetical protein
MKPRDPLAQRDGGALPLRLRLDEAAFRQLCAGQVVRVVSAGGRRAEIILADIGIVPMLRAVVDGASPAEGKEKRR